LEVLLLATVALCTGMLGWLLSGRLVAAQAARREGERGERAMFSTLLARPGIAQTLLVAVAVVIAWFVLQKPLVCFLLAVAGVWVPRKLRAWKRAKRQSLIDGQIPDMLGMMSGTLRAGASLMSAMDSVIKDGPDPIKREIDLTMREVRMGIDLDLALDHMARRVGGAEMVMVSAAIKIARESGGNLSESLENLARSVRDRQNMEKKILALTAQGRMQALVMAGLPFFMLYMLHQLDAQAMAPMFSTVLGWSVFVAVCIWVWIGFKVIKKIMSIDI
ncbi:MAG: hypothetical protein EOO24_09695, partial [Comamonadaceae bacterium]